MEHFVCCRVGCGPGGCGPALFVSCARAQDPIVFARRSDSTDQICIEEKDNGSLALAVTGGRKHRGARSDPLLPCWLPVGSGADRRALLHVTNRDDGRGAVARSRAPCAAPARGDGLTEPARVHRLCLDRRRQRTLSRHASGGGHTASRWANLLTRKQSPHNTSGFMWVSCSAHVLPHTRPASLPPLLQLHPFAELIIARGSNN